jgi:ABC-type Fe3+-hydroxamate transport system substrate-binding protein
MKTFTSLFIVVLSAAVLTACTGSSTTPTTTTSNSAAGAPAADQKSGDSTKTGTITAAGGKFFLQEAGDTPREIESYAVDLNDYVGQTVTVTGQYSGDTLFVGSVE